MASTNKTSNYDLSQYIGTDKPTYLGDYNSDMLKIDTAMAENKTSAENAVQVANNASATAGNAQTTATTAQNTANQANTLAETAKTSADNAQSTADNANLTANNLSNYLNMNSFNDITSGGQVTQGSGTVDAINLTIATNADKTLGKIYGTFNLNNVNGGTTEKIKFSNLPIYITESFTIKCIGSCMSLSAGQPTGYPYKPVNVTLTKNASNPNNSDIEFDVTPDGSISGAGLRLIIYPCLLFFKNFGDTSANN